MAKLQRTSKGEYFMVLPGEMARIAGWKEGDEIEVRLGSDLTPRSKDLVLRKK